MSKNWTPNELQAASAAMKAAAQMSFEEFCKELIEQERLIKMMTEKQAKNPIESLLPLQEDESIEPFPCPRCGHPRMLPGVRNALSRRAKVYICSECGMDESLRDMAGLPPLPLNLWNMAVSFSEKE